MNLSLRGFPSFLSARQGSWGGGGRLPKPWTPAKKTTPTPPLASPAQVPAEVALPPAWLLASTLRPHRRGGSLSGSAGQRAPQVPAEEEGTRGGGAGAPPPLAGRGAFISAASAGPHVA